MPPTAIRHAFVALLILGTGLLSVRLPQHERPVPALPSVGSLTVAGDWQVDTVYQPPALGPVARQWLLHDSNGNAVLLYVGVTSHLQSAMRWSGELGYQGDGYVVLKTADRTLRLENGSTETVGTAAVRRLADQRYLAYAVIGPDGPVALWPDALLHTALGALAGRVGPYFMVRVSAVDTSVHPAARFADPVLTSVLPHLLRLARSS